MRWWRAGLARLGVRTGPGRDAVAAGLLLVLLTVGRLGVSTLVAARQPVPSPVPADAVAIGFALSAADCLALVLRRRLPVAALGLGLAVVLVCGRVDQLYAEPGLGLVCCAYTVACALPRRLALPALAGSAAVHYAGGLLLGDVSALPTYWGVPAANTYATAVASVASVGLPALVGSWVRSRRAYTAALLARADERARTAVAEERGRIARELHDIAAHDLSALVVQAGAADRLVDRDPDAAKETLREIRAQGRDTLSQLRRLVGVMREGDTDGLSPAPTLRRLDELVAGVRATGATVEVVTTGTVRALPAEVDLAAYRVLQEALVNTRRHAPGGAVRIEVAHLGAGGVRVAVLDSGPAVAPPRSDGPGYGLVGMRERVRQVGGTLRVGPTADGGWQVEALLPGAADR